MSPEQHVYVLLGVVVVRAKLAVIPQTTDTAMGTRGKSGGSIICGAAV
jgi:hypothetical protein